MKKCVGSFITSAHLILFFFSSTAITEASDWPMWGNDISRSHTTDVSLSETLHLQWERQLPSPQRAWPWQMDDFEKLDFDASYEPVVYGNLVYISSMVTDDVTAYHIDTGAEKWRYITNGPVRMAPAVWEGKVYVASDDGNLFCLDAATGEKIWKYRVASTNRLVLGNERLISMWPVRGGPVIQDGTLYFAAGIWPHEGVFINAINAETGEVVWVNSDSASDIYTDSKRFYSFGGVAPQGQLVLSGDYLLVPGGRTVPAVFNRHTGEFLYLRLPTHTTGKGAGGHRVFTHNDWYFNVRDNTATHVYALVDGAQHSEMHIALATDEALFGVDPGNGQLHAYQAEFELVDEDLPQPEPVGRDVILERGRVGADDRAPGIEGRMQRGILSEYYETEKIWKKNISGLNRLHIKAGSMIYGSGTEGRIFALDVSDIHEEPRIAWMRTVKEEVFSMVAAQDRLFVVTREGRIYCFGPELRESETYEYTDESMIPEDDEWSDRAGHLLEETGVEDGYGVMFGIGSGRLLEELLVQSDLHITAYDPDPDKVARFRDQFIRRGYYGSRVAVHEGDANTVQLPPYIAELIVSEDPVAAGMDAGDAFARALFRPLRPYGGTAYLPIRERSWYRPFSGDKQQLFIEAAEGAELENGQISKHRDYVLLSRPGPLPGSDTWTHQYSDAANTAFSADKRVKVPLGITWFGGPPNHKTLPRHMHGPIPQIVEGKQIILGVDHISARCVYTGRELWVKELPLVGENFTSLEHEAQPAPVYFPNNPGANFIGSPYASAEDAIYVIYEDRCLRLDTSTGELLDSFEMPDRDELMQFKRDPLTDQMMESYGPQLQEGEQLRWGNIRYNDNWLIAAAYPHMFDESQPGRESNWNATSSEFIVVMNRHTGDIEWVHQARYGFRHNAIAVGSGKVFLIDNLSEEIQQVLTRRGIEPDTEPQIQAFDIHTGDMVWSYEDEVFGTSLSYSGKNDVLVQSGHHGRRRTLPDEPRDRLLALQGENGQWLWAESLRQRRAPLGMHETRGHILGSTTERATDMLTGEQVMHTHPVTGEQEPWTWLGALRCGTQNYSEHLIAFRSGAAGITDLNHNSGTGNIPGFRPGCTNNLVVADGMLNAPEYTRSCSCSYQLQTSLGLTHMPEAEWWTFSHLSDPVPGTIKRIGINFGAPGSRLAEQENVFWVEYPKVGGPAPEIPLVLETNDEREIYRHHISLIEEENNGHRWVTASGVEGISSFMLGGLLNDSSNPGEGYTYTVRLHFAEPAEISNGERVFDVFLQGNEILRNLDIMEKAGGARRVFVARIEGVEPDENGQLKLDFISCPDSERSPLISGIDVWLEE